MWGIETKDYTTEDYGPETDGGKLVRRDYLQARKADAIFAVGKIVAPGEKGLPD